MPHTANMILVDYANKFPAGDGGGTSSGKHSRVRHGVVTLGQYMHSEGFKHRKKETSRRLKLDFEAFVVKMETIRKWDLAKSTKEWEVLKKNPANHADEKGPPPYTLRLRIPSCMTGEDASASEDEHFESKEYQKKSKEIKDPKEEQELKIKAELKIGFNEMLSRPSGGLFTPTPSNAVTYEGTPPSMDISSIMAGWLAKDDGGSAPSSTTAGSGSSQSSAPETPHAKKERQGEAPEESPTPTPPPTKAPPTADPFDLASKRGSLHRQTAREHKAQEKKLCQSAAALSPQLKQHSYTAPKTETEYHAAVERLQVTLLLLGMKGGGGGGDTPDYNTMCPITIDDIREDRN